jgi:hypothetical protein
MDEVRAKSKERVRVQSALAIDDGAGKAGRVLNPLLASQGGEVICGPC